MNQMLLLKVGVGGLVVMMGFAGVLLWVATREQRVAARLEAVRTGRIGSTVSRESGNISARGALQMIAGMGQSVLKSGVVSSQTVNALEKSLESAGIRSANAVAVFVAAKIVLALLLPLLMFGMIHGRFESAMMRNLLLAAAAAGGLLTPDYIVGSLRKRYQSAIADGLPDAMDMLVMCAESGLSLEPALVRVGTEIGPAHPAVASELMLTANEFQISTDSISALAGLGERTGLSEMKRLVGTLSQTLQYGTPLAEALRVLSAEMRTEILTRFEEKAAKLPVLLTLPMIMFILPSLFMVVGGPAILQAIRTIHV